MDSQGFWSVVNCLIYFLRLVPSANSSFSPAVSSRSAFSYSLHFSRYICPVWLLCFTIPFDMFGAFFFKCAKSFFKWFMQKSHASSNYNKWVLVLHDIAWLKSEGRIIYVQAYEIRFNAVVTRYVLNLEQHRRLRIHRNIKWFLQFFFPFDIDIFEFIDRPHYVILTKLWSSNIQCLESSKLRSAIKTVINLFHGRWPLRSKEKVHIHLRCDFSFFTVDGLQRTSAVSNNLRWLTSNYLYR